MIRIEHVEVHGWEMAIRGMRNPLNSWEKSDSYYGMVEDPEPINPCDWADFIIGPNDLGLMHRLAAAGSDHRKFMRMIMVGMDITAPLYWFKEFDTYKVGTVANSCSTMHTIHTKEFTLDDFSHEHLLDANLKALNMLISHLNACRELFNATKGKVFWQQMIQLLPTSYNQKRTVLLNYEVLRNIYHARRHHKLDEWHGFCDMVETLPHAELITGKKEGDI